MHFPLKLTLYTFVILKYLPVVLKDERQRWYEYCRNDYRKCPICFDQDDESSRETFLDNIRVDSSFNLDVSELFGNRKIQHGMMNDQQKMILKYLLSDESFDDLANKCCDSGTDECANLWLNKSNVDRIKSKLLRLFSSKLSVAGFQVCPSDSVNRFMEIFSQQSIYAWLLLNLNVEPLIVETLAKRNFPVPKLHASCGFVTLQSNNGLPLYTFFDESFAVRLLIAQNLLRAAKQFSYGVEGFR